MCRIGSPWTLAIPTVVLMAVVPILLQNATSRKDRAGPDFASSLIKIFKDRIPHSCWEKEDDIQALKCFLAEGEGSISVSREESKRFIHAFQKYEGQNRVAREMTTAAVALIILSAIYLSSYCRAMLGRVVYRGN